MSRSLKKVLPVVAAIAVPIAAPVVAQAVVGQAAFASMTTAAQIGASAISGAAMGAVSAKVLGQDVKKGILAGAIGGGLGGWQNAASASTSANVAANGGRLGADPTGGYARSAATNNAVSTQSQAINAARNKTAAGVSQANMAANATQNVGFIDSLRAVPGKIAANLKDPQFMADMTVKAAANIASGLLFKPEDSAEMRAYTRELAALKARDEAAYNLKVQAAKTMLAQARYHDPGMAGNRAQAAQRQMDEERIRSVRQEAAMRQGRAGLSPGENRRAQLDMSRNQGGAFDRGFTQGLARQNNLATSAYNMMGNVPKAYAEGLKSLHDMRREGEQDVLAQRRNFVKSIAGTYAGGMGRQYGREAEERIREDERRRKRREEEDA